MIWRYYRGDPASSNSASAEAPTATMTSPTPNSNLTQEQKLCSRFLAAIPLQVNSNPHLVWRGRTLAADCLVEIGQSRFLLGIDHGIIRECRTDLPLLCPWTFAVRGSVQAWTRLWEDPPPPGWHDLFALSKRGEMAFEGNLQPFMAHLQYCKDVLSLPRKAAT
jgi:hypothetical protein